MFFTFFQQMFLYHVINTMIFYPPLYSGYKFLRSNFYLICFFKVLGDPSMGAKQRAFIVDAARALDKAKMMRYDEKSGNFYCTELGRIASHFYLQYSSVETYNEMLRRHMSESVVGIWFACFICLFSL